MLDKRVQELASTIAGLWQNQQSLDAALKGLIKSEAGLDDQVAVLTRLFFVETNRLRDIAGVAPLGREEVEPVFAEWATFRARPDANQHMQHWVFGMPLDELPPPPEPPEESEEPAKQEFLEDDISKLQEAVEGSPEDTESDDERPEGSNIFGGNYAESDHGDIETRQGGEEHNSSGSEDEVPSLQPQDDAISADGEGSSEVSEVPA